MKLSSRITIEPMREEDIPAVLEVEKEIFSTPWPRNAYQRELLQNRTAHYIVLREEERLLGYAGLWRLYEEAHVTTIGVGRAGQGRGLGKALMLALIDIALLHGARWMTLEVRATNDVAIRMYERFGFKAIGRRRGYYSDNNEDAIVMWSDSLSSEKFRTTLELNRADIGPDVSIDIGA